MSPSTKKWLQRQKRRHPPRWKGAQNNPIFTAPPSLPKPQTKILTATNEFLDGVAVFRHADNIWTCIQTSPFLNFLKGLDEAKAHLELLRRNFKWQWTISSPLRFTRDDELDRPADASARPSKINTPTCSQDSQGIALSATETCAESRAAGRTGATVRAG